MSDECLDVFCHILPVEYCAAANRRLTRPSFMFTRAQAIPVMVNLEARFAVMDQFPGYRQIPSLASPTPEQIAGPEESPELARIANDALAKLVSTQRDRFPSFVAALPLNNPEAALVEAERAVKQLGAAGVQIMTSMGGRPLDEPPHLAWFELAAKLGCAVWLHPTRPMTRPDYPVESVSKFDIWWSLGWPFETSVAMLRLAFAGLFDRCPDLPVITHHVGGIIPLLEGRLGSGMELLGTRTPPEHADAVRHQLQEPPLSALRRFYADTASFGSRAAIECGRTFFGADRLMFATDMPFDPDQGPGYIRATLKAIRETSLSEPERKGILAGNAVRVLNLL
jgi:aminocarboxymuconate-semialdehyde decarboxylase